MLKHDDNEILYLTSCKKVKHNLNLLRVMIAGMNNDEHKIARRDL